MMKTHLVLLLAFSFVATDQPSLLEGVLKFTAEGQHQKNVELKEQTHLLAEYDFIVVGAGTAGCVLAARLSENPKWKVLLLEAGGPENYVMDIPMMAHYLQFSQANWNYRTQPGKNYCLAMEGGRCHWPRGKVMGGSSVLNYMIYTRGNHRDYDTWAAMGNVGWSYRELLPYFKKVEDFRVFDVTNTTTYHQRGGPVGVSYAPYHSKIAEAIVESAQELGMTYVDYNGQYQAGVSYLQASLKDGIRASASRSYLYPISDRVNLHLKQYAHVTRLLIEPETKTVYGVEFVRNHKRYKVYASKEVVVAAGAINTPQLLMLSGIGPKRHLDQLQIPVVVDSRVGYNLQDHIATGGITLLIDRNYSISLERILDQEVMKEFMFEHRGPWTVTGGCEVITFNNLDDPFNRSAYPDIELLFEEGSIVSEKLIYKNLALREDIYQEMFVPLIGHETFTFFPMLLRPKSRGRIILNNTDYQAKPLIFPNYLDHPDDVATIIKGIRLAQKILEQKSLKAIGTRLYQKPLPGCEDRIFDSDAYWECHTRYITMNIYHYSGTCKMGPRDDRDAVVDPRLRVYGLKGLRVIDASIIPKLPAAHTNAVVFMIAEKGADMIKQDWSE